MSQFRYRASIAWLVATVAVATLAAACAGGLRRETPRGPAAKAPGHLRIRLTDGAVRRVALEEYVRGTIISEFAPAAGDPSTVSRMLEVQAVIARSYAIANLTRHSREGFNLCSTTHCQLYQPARLKTSTWARAAAGAAQRTSGMVLWHGGSAATALYHADCGGHTSGDGEVWGGAAHPYLVAVADDGPARTAHAAWRFEVEEARLVSALNADGKTRVGRQLKGIAILERDRGGRARLVALRGTRDPLVRGEELRLALSRAFGPKAIRSTRFDVTQSGSTYVFTGQGFGHGVGLCQAGALARLRAGARPDQVLARYYPGTQLVVLR
ncbi:MAG: SpoIID/LytB domain-containing protein [Vicinamibacterales bacterium]